MKEDEAKKIRYAATQADQHVANLMGEMQKVEAERTHVLDMYEQMQTDHARLKGQVTADEAHVAEKKTFLHAQAEETQSLEAKHQSCHDELKQAMADGLSAAENARLTALTTTLENLKESERVAHRELEHVRSKKAHGETRLETHLRRRANEIRALLEENSLLALHATERKTSANMKSVDVEDAKRAEAQHQRRCEQMDKDMAACEASLMHARTDVERLEAQLAHLKARVRQETSKAEKVLSTRRRLLQKRDDLMRDIRELGTLPMSELEKVQAAFEHKHPESVSKRFHRVTERLQSFSHVNKKALDQYVSFREQRSTLLARKEELEHGDASIQELIDVLDRRKDEAILRTFKGVSHHFSQVFRELVPTGEGKMLILRSDADESMPPPPPLSQNHIEQPPQQQQHQNVDTSTFVGVQIKVSFRGEGDSYLMQQLSGGQKALVALAFIFAIQRCDPAPFYLFDEIDQALDSTHRAAVAALIHRQAHSEENPAQFITSTFRPEMVMVADQFYGIGHQNKISNIYPMTKEESLEFIANIMADEEAVEDNNTIKMSKDKNVPHSRRHQKSHVP
jgi:structural maintenance of chromosome 3 (chondroitin sulfate proteoglycan 6)